MQDNNEISAFWFRRDLRLEDNHGLYEALNNSSAVLPVFIFDKNILGQLTLKEDKRISFIYDTLKVLNEKLLSHGSSLLVIYDTPEKAMGKICSEFRVKAVYANHDYEPYALQRDNEIKKWLAEKGVQFLTFKDQVIFEKSEILKPDGMPYTVFTPYSKRWKNALTPSMTEPYHSGSLLHKLFRTKPLPILELNATGFKRADYCVAPAEFREDIIRNYDKTRNFPAIEGTSRMSVHLRFGTVSIRALVACALQWNVIWLDELIWREFFMMILFHYPYVAKSSFKKKYDLISWRNDEKEFEAWCRGITGFSLVDAGMRELNETGLMHNRVRMVVAGFLVKDLLIDWRWGELYFAEKLLDYELSSNNGNWQWAAGCGCDAAPYFRVFNPLVQADKFDTGSLYINRWLPKGQIEFVKPIVVHEFAKKRAVDAYMKALK